MREIRHHPLCAVHGFSGQCSCGASPDSFFHGMPFTTIPFGSQVGADPAEHPRWDGQRIRPYDEGDE